MKMISVGKLLTCARNPLTLSFRQLKYSMEFMIFLKNLPGTQTSILRNELVVATERRDCRDVCIGLYMDGGSRYESNLENGITHFFEHIAFKGTSFRTKENVESAMNKTGATFHCFTTRELVGYYAQCLNDQLSLVMDLLAESLFSNRVDEQEIELQKRVAYTELEKQDNNMNKVLFDYLHATAFQGTPLSNSVMGLSTNLYNFQPRSILIYLRKNFNPRRMVLAAVGGISHGEVVKLAELHLQKYDAQPLSEEHPHRYTGSEVRYRNDSMPMANVALAFEGPRYSAFDNVKMQVAAAMIGGWDKSQPGGLGHANYLARGASVIEACEAYQAFNINYKDTGLWGVQFLASSHQLEDMVYLIQTKLMSLCTMTTDSDMDRATHEVKTELLRSTATNAGACYDIGRNLLYRKSRPSLHKRIAEVESLTAADVRTACDTYLYDRCPAVAALGPTEALPDYSRIRAGQYWLRT